MMNARRVPGGGAISSSTRTVSSVKPATETEQRNRTWRLAEEPVTLLEPVACSVHAPWRQHQVQQFGEDPAVPADELGIDAGNVDLAQVAAGGVSGEHPAGDREEPVPAARQVQGLQRQAGQPGQQLRMGGPGAFRHRGHGAGVSAAAGRLPGVFVAVKPGGGDVVGAEGTPADGLVLHAQRSARGAVPLGGPAAGLVIPTAELGCGRSADGEANWVELRASDVAGQPPGYFLARAFPDGGRGGPGCGHVRRPAGC